MRVRHLLVVAVLLAPAAAPAGDRGAVRLDQALRDLASELRVACLAAHPDDEDSATLSLLRRKYGIETHLLLFTRGEGGQNESGDELDEDLALVRTEETLAAAAVSDTRVTFLDFPDFGYSKSSAETFERWGREETLRRLVAALRAVRPHVVITNHDAVTGHGHHQAVGIAALQAFEAAADPERFPDAGPPWEASRLYVRCEPGAADWEPEVSEVEPLRALTFAEMGLAALREHRSQGTWDFVAEEPGWARRAYRLALSRGGVAGRGIEGLAIPGPAWLREEARSGTASEILARVRAEPPSDRRNRAIAAVLGIEAEARIDGGPFVPGASVPVRAIVRSRGTLPFTVRGISFDGAAGVPGGEVRPGGALEATTTLPVPGDAAPNRPIRDHSREPPDLRLRVEVGVEVAVPESEETVTVTAATVIPVYPPLTLAISSAGRLFRPVLRAGTLAVVVENHGPEAREVELQAEVLDTDRVEARAPGPFALGPGERRTVAVPLVALDGIRPGLFAVEVRAAGAPPARAPLRVLDVEVPLELRIGLVRTYDEEAFRALRAMGLRPDLLTDEDLSTGDLSEYDTIWLGIRPWLSRPVLRDASGRLLEWVRDGGTLIVNYSKEREWSPAFAPWPLRIGSDRVTREDAPIEFPDPAHRLLRFPNEIVAEDFGGWVQERGLYFPSEWDAGEYRTILATSDPGENALPGLLLARHGEGRYVYTCLGWYRQLRALNPAALKMLANLVSLPCRGPSD